MRYRHAGKGDLPDQNHLLLQLAAAVELGADLVVEVEELLERLVLRGHDKADDVHEKRRHRISVEHNGQDALHGLDLGLIGTLLQLHAQIGDGGDVGRIVLVDETVCILEEARHLDECQRRLAEKIGGGGGGCCKWDVAPRGTWEVGSEV